MNKILIPLLGLFLISTISAVQIEMHPEYKQGETMVVKISGNFVTPIEKLDILFYKGHERVSFEYDFTKVGYDYFLYAVLQGKPEGNYSLLISDVRYEVGGVIKEEDIIQNFSISNETADFSVKPGFISSSGNFSLIIQNLKDEYLKVAFFLFEQPREVYISSPKISEEVITLRAGETKKINFIVGVGEEIFDSLFISSENLTYEIPVFLSATGVSTPSQTGTLEFQPPSLVIHTPPNVGYKQTIYLFNHDNVSNEGVSISLSEELSYIGVLSKENIDINPNSSVPINLSFFSEEEETVRGYVYAEFGNISISLPVYIAFSANSSGTELPKMKLCSELNGTLCETQTHKCDVNLISAKDGWCCTGTCSEIKANKGNSGKIIAVLLILILIGFVTWFYFAKYKKSKKPVDLLKVAKGKEKLKLK